MVPQLVLRPTGASAGEHHAAHDYCNKLSESLLTHLCRGELRAAQCTLSYNYNSVDDAMMV